jgi:hypothetical protein
MQQKMGEIAKPKVHLYHVQVDDELAIKGRKWDQIFKKSKLDESLDEGHRTQLWALLEEFHRIFTWHK